MTTDTTVLISGAGIAGPSLAHWLRRFGFVPTVVEQAPGLRDSGGAVDFRGAQVEVLRRMDILAAVQAQQTAMGAQVVIDGDGEPLVNLPSAFFSGEVEIERGDLARILYDLTRDTTEYVFGDSITSLAETTDGVDVTFRHGAPAPSTWWSAPTACTRPCGGSPSATSPASARTWATASPASPPPTTSGWTTAA